ncbi:MAG: hypothetical protein HS108_13880 [Planctomycetes bacterium]|jgi:predicted  nucleic acid-binding Zn-ribbon protein|nr:hypothetical protein [Planctomycetota bacterium]
MSGFADQLNLMWQLRELDARVFAAVSRAALAARETANAASAEAAARKKLDDAKARLRDLERRERDTEVEINALQKRLGQLEDTVNSATSDAIRKQAADALAKERAGLDALENTGLGLLDEIEKAKAAVTAAEAAHKTATDRVAAAKAAQDGHQAAAAATQQEVAGPRGQLAAAMQEELLHAYESARSRHPDSPICGIKDSFCEGCSGELTMHHATRARARNEVIRCPHCTRIHDSR